MAIAPSSGSLLPTLSFAALLLAAAEARSQTPPRAATAAAIADAHATEAGGFVLAIPGVADDFVLFADGQWLTRANGTARWSGYVQRSSAVDRDFFVELEFAGRVAPGNPNHPPAGAPVTTLLPGAYAPAGPVDPSTFVYYTQVTGSMTGLRAFTGARIDLANSGPAQVGTGATNKNVLPGLAVDLTTTVVQAPAAVAFAPTGPAQLRVNFQSFLGHCATHVDGDMAASGQTSRRALDLPGVAADYVFIPGGEWRENPDGTATLSGVLRRQSDYDDRWSLQLTLSGRVDPGAAAHPPGSGPALQLLPSAYTSQGGPIDPAAWRYYTTASGTLTGQGGNGGGTVQLTAAAPLQVGLGAGQGNFFYGLHGALSATVTQQPNGAPLAITGNVRLNTNLGTNCILPAPQVQTGLVPSIDTVTSNRLVYTGTDLGFVEQAAFGPIILGSDTRRWFEGFFTIVDHQTIEFSVPQGLAPGSRPLTFLNSTRISNTVSVNLTAPTTTTMRSEQERLTGETQHWVAHQGNLPGLRFCLLIVSTSDQPSVAPGVVTLQIGAQFTDYVVLGAALHDPATGAAVVQMGSLPASLSGHEVHSQAALLDLSVSFPLQPSNAWSTTYQ